tara:strand:- start:1680 stop:2534 length:855 start_codon:yes stop_codon:yes gene_type:complete
MTKFLKKIINLLYSIKNSHFSLKIIHNKNKLFFKKKYDISKKIIVRRSDGFKKVSFTKNKNYNEAINFIRKKYKINSIIKKSKSKKGFLKVINLNIFENNSIYKLANDKFIIDALSNYFESIPILYNAQLWVSKPNKTKEHSQLFHFDREDYLQMKVFFPISGIDRESGPIKLINAKQSREFLIKCLKTFKVVSLKDRHSDKFVFDKIKNPRIVEMTAKENEAILVDTTNCIHYGSRSSKKKKYQLLLHYVTPYSPKVFSHLIKNDINNINTMSYLASSNQIHS